MKGHQNYINFAKTNVEVVHLQPFWKVTGPTIYQQNQQQCAIIVTCMLGRNSYWVVYARKSSILHTKI